MDAILADESREIRTLAIIRLMGHVDKACPLVFRDSLHQAQHLAPKTGAEC